MGGGLGQLWFSVGYTRRHFDNIPMVNFFIARQHTDARYNSVRPSVCNVQVSDENGLTYRHSYFTIQ